MATSRLLDRLHAPLRRARAAAALGAGACLFAGVALAQDIYDDGLEMSILGTIVLLPILLLIHQLVIVAVVKRWMYGSSEAEVPELPEGMDRPERGAGSELEFLELDGDVEIPEVQVFREDIVAQALAALRRRWHVSLLAAVGYIAVPWLLGAVSGEPYGNHLGFVAVLAVAYAILVSLSYLANRNEYYAAGHIGSVIPDVYGALFSLFIKAWLKPGYNIVMWLFFVSVIATDPNTEDSETYTVVSSWVSAGVYAMVVAHALMMLRGFWVPDNAPNIKLLVLRVFGRSRGARLTFERLIEPWRFFGMHFTVDDPSFARYRYRIFQKRTLVLMLLLGFLYAINHWIGSAVLAAVVAWDWAGLYQRRPVHTPQEARERIDRVIARPRTLFGQFRDTRMVCYMNTWKLVVDEFIGRADVVLFDLRDFTEENAGSTYEINFLFDNYPLESILFLRDKKSDSEAIYAAIREQWKELREGSPNLDAGDPVVNVYVSSKENARDVQGLMDTLLAVARYEHLEDGIAGDVEAAVITEADEAVAPS